MRFYKMKCVYTRAVFCTNKRMILITTTACPFHDDSLTLCLAVSIVHTQRILTKSIFSGVSKCYELCL